MFGSLPLKQKGSIPLELVDFIEIPDKDKYAGCRFNLVSKRYGKFHHPRHHQDDRGLQVTERRFCLYAPDIAVSSTHGLPSIRVHLDPSHDWRHCLAFSGEEAMGGFLNTTLWSLEWLLGLSIQPGISPT